jgi:speckle-type POZ protein
VAAIAPCPTALPVPQIPVHRIILEARSPVFRALLNAPMREGQEGRVVLRDVRAPVVRALLHFVYSDSLPDELQDQGLDTAMAQVSARQGGVSD